MPAICARAIHRRIGAAKCGSNDQASRGTAIADALAQIVLRLYESPGDPEHWQGILRLTARHLGSTGLALLFPEDAAAGSAAHIIADVPPSALAALRADRAPEPGDSAPVQRDISGVGWGAAGRVLCAPVAGGAGPAARLILFRAPDAAEFDGYCRAAFTSILPHLARALGVAQRLHALTDETGWQSCGTNLLPFGRMALDSEGRMLAGNDAARAALAAADAVRLEGDRVVAASRVDNVVLQRHLRELLAAAETGRRRFLRVRPRQGGGACLVRLEVCLPKPSRFGIRMPKIEMILIDTRRTLTVPCETVCVLYGLTPAECELARRIGAGEPLKRVADRLGIAMPTARTHLQKVFAKTGTRRQVELIRLLIAPFGVCSLGGPR
jgi:DNA-binding CsgD family transcriptional regulator